NNLQRRGTGQSFLHRVHNTSFVLRLENSSITHDPDLRSESRNVRESQFPTMYMHTAKLGTATQLRKDLAGIEQMLGIEGTFDPHLLVEIDFVEHFRHQIALFYADPMFAGENAADFHA